MYDYKIVVSLPLLMDHEDLILQLLYTRVRPRETRATIDARLYYVFTDREYGEILSVVAFTRDAGTVLVNGIEVERDNIFFEAVLPFLPEDAAAKIRSIVGL